MQNYKNQILASLCYTELVYQRINKKLKLDYSKQQIEALVLKIIEETDTSQFYKKGKNIYIQNEENNIQLTINSFTNRIITADRLILF
jgi:hypothetical protein